ncbi:hypothetical protein [Acidovorax sp. Root219]|uniref:hypothetical protein n=1 Tax=Acidovorax sp. Root219 TaxID=1736493 RepID=UPI000708DE07|nr:hypothetical protein [Acidovorax sp. Root219]KRC36257.1 hypothetical protein ASE28_01610 [Acidovorax sp. Root219]
MLLAGGFLINFHGGGMHNNESEGGLQFAKARNDENDFTELRFSAPKWLVAVIDAHWQVRGGSRASVAQKVLGDWARLELHAATVTTRVVRGNPDLPDLPPAAGEG